MIFFIFLGSLKETKSVDDTILFRSSLIMSSPKFKVILKNSLNTLQYVLNGNMILILNLNKKFNI